MTHCLHGFQTTWHLAAVWDLSSVRFPGDKYGQTARLYSLLSHVCMVGWSSRVHIAVLLWHSRKNGKQWSWLCRYSCNTDRILPETLKHSFDPNIFQVNLQKVFLVPHVWTLVRLKVWKHLTLPASRWYRVIPEQFVQLVRNTLQPST